MYMWDVWAYILLDCTEEETFFWYAYVLNFTSYLRERNRIKCIISSKMIGSEEAMRLGRGICVLIFHHTP